MYLQDLEEGRSFAAAEVVDGCLVVSGGDTVCSDYIIFSCTMLHNKQVAGPTDSVEVVGGGLAGCAWSHGEVRLPRPRSGHCLVRVGGELVAVGGGPDNYGSTQVSCSPRAGHHAQHAGVQPRHRHLAGRPASAEGPRAARLQQAGRGRRGGRG